MFLRRLFGGPRMATLSAGTAAPDFTLPGIDGKQFSLRQALARGPVVLAFFKVSCPVCQFALPFIERIYKAHGNVTIAGVSQDDRKETAAFAKEYGLTFPILLDDTKKYPVSNAYGLTNVPTVFWIAQDGSIEISSVGWLRGDIDDINRKAAKATGTTANPVFQPREDIPEFRAG